MSIKRTTLIEAKAVIDNSDFKDKIPKDILEILDNANKGSYKRILKDEISRETLVFLTYLILKYVASDEVKNELKEILIKNRAV